MRSTIAVVLAGALVTAACSTTATGGKGAPASVPAAAQTSTSASTVAAASASAASAAPVTTDATPLPSVPQQSAVNPCTLVTQHDANKITGVTLHKAVRTQESCMFATPTSGSVGQFEIYVGDGAKKAYDIDHAELHHAFTTQTGVGNEAHLENGAIFFRKNATWVELKALRLDGVDIGPALTAEARIAASRMT